MTTLFLLRHGRSTANSKGILAGRKPGIHLDETGQKQAAEIAQRLLDVEFDALVTSPMERCQETIAPVAVGRRRTVRLDEGLIEADYGTWSGRKLAELSKDPLWPTLQSHPSAVRFPGRTGESVLGVQQRAIETIRRINAKLGPSGVWLACSHGDIISTVLADALGMHLDQYQRIVVAPASISVIQYSANRPAVLTMNSSAGSLTQYAVRETANTATVGGTTGTESSSNSKGRRTRR